MTRAGRIAFFLHDLRQGGAERISVALANGMHARGHAVDLVLVRRAGAPAYFDSIEPGINLLSLERARTLTSIIGFRRYLDAARPDAVIAAMTHINVAAIAARRLARHKSRLIVVEHNQMSRNIRRKRGLVRLAYGAVPWIYRDADVIAAVSEGVKADLAALTGLPHGRIEVLYNPVVTPQLLRQAEQDPGDPWFAPGAPPVVLAAGRLTPQKNFAMLIESFRIMRKARPARLLILGEGPAAEELRSLAAISGYADDIRIDGFVANPFGYMRRAAVLALSSDWEGLPTVLIEAMACGTPVVATDCPSGPREILEDGRLAPLVPTGDAAAFAAALKQTLDRRPVTDALTARAHAFSQDAAVDRYLDVAGLSRRRRVAA